MRRPCHHPDYLVGQIEQVFDLVTCQEDRRACVRQVAQRLRHPAAIRRRDPEKRLVGDQTGRCRGHGQPDLGSTSLTARHLTRPRVEEGLYVQRSCRGGVEG